VRRNWSSAIKEKSAGGFTIRNRRRVAQRHPKTIGERYSEIGRR
jgi:hypothetical protein